jgi:hypothetical protein
MSDTKDLDLWLTELRHALRTVMTSLSDAESRTRAGYSLDAISYLSNARIVLELLIDSIDFALTDADPRAPPS